MKHRDVIFSALFRIVGQEFTQAATAEKEWYKKHTWTKEEQSSFATWLEGYLLSSKAAREEMMKKPLKNREVVQQAANEFIACYGWAEDEISRKKANRR